MSKQHAFTLIELLIVLALVAILGQIAAPALQDFLARNQQQALYNQISRSLQHARSYAVTNRVSVELCGTHDGLTCHTDWSQGWLLRELNNDSLIAVTLLDSDQQHLHWSGFQKEIEFHSNGISPRGNGRFYNCYKNTIGWQLILNRQGRLRTTSPNENAADSARCK